MWKPGDLPVRGRWLKDGPFLPIEFARQSWDGRITLVLVEGVPSVRTLWAELALSNLEEAAESLRRREGIPEGPAEGHVGVWLYGAQLVENRSQEGNEVVARIDPWGRSHGLDAIVWTNLPPKFRDESDRVPTAEEVISYLSDLKGAARTTAEHYVRMTPRQIATEYRRRIEAKLGWTPYDCAD